MGIVARIIQPGVVVTLHTSPGGSGELARSQPLSASLFAEQGNHAVNMQRVTIPARASGTAFYFGVWVDNRLRSVGRLERRVQLREGDSPFFLPGRLRVEFTEMVS